jgi:hypothetical protein
MTSFGGHVPIKRDPSDKVYSSHCPMTSFRGACCDYQLILGRYEFRELLRVSMLIFKVLNDQIQSPH